ncbi:TPA: glycosyltransferase, partial [Campylobacter jejuni]|nr:glycosyltransferase [Campylobacter jejuni]
MPKISIILPTFNVEKYIARAIESCINQTFK